MSSKRKKKNLLIQKHYPQREQYDQTEQLPKEIKFLHNMIRNSLQ